MEPIELELTYHYSECPDCGCTISYARENSKLSDDIFYSFEYASVDNYDDNLDGYRSWTIYKAFELDCDVHDCGCSCSWSDGSQTNVMDMIASSEYDNEDLSDERFFRCGNCRTPYSKLSIASSCCQPAQDVQAPATMKFGEIEIPIT